jgi:translocation and assembly module TamB
VNVTVTPPTSAAQNELPVDAKIQGTFNLPAGSLDLDAASLKTRGLQVNAMGAMGSERAELKLQLSATKVADLEPLVAAIAGKSTLPMDLRGSATFDGILRGNLMAPQLRGRLQVHDFDLLVSDASQPQKPPRRVHWDSLATDLDYSRQALALQNGALDRGKARILFAGRTTLHQGSFDEKSVFSSSASLINADLADLQTMAGVAYPITGTVNAKVNAQGTKRDIHGGAQLTVANGTIFGEPFKDLRGDLTLAGDDVQLRSFSLSQNGATLTSTGSYDLQTKAFRAEAHGRNFDLAHIQRLHTARLSLTGRGTFDVNASGTLDEPAVEAKLSIVNIIANGEPIGDININAVTHGREMRLTMRSQLEAASLAVDGNVHLAGDFPSNIAVHFENLDFDPVLRAFLQNRVTGHSSMNGRIDITGPLKRWRSLQVHGVVPEVSAQVEKITLTNSGPVEFDYADQIATIRQLHLRGEGTDFEATGRVKLVNHQLDLRARGDLNLKLVEGFYPDLVSYGTVKMELTVGGTTKEPVPIGQLTVQNAGVSFLDLPNGLTNINGTLVFNENRLQVQRLTAQTGGGILNIGGFISYQNGLYFDLTASGRDVRLRYPQGISAAANADLRYSGTLQSSTLSGDVLVTKFGVNQRFDFALYVARGKTPPASPKPNPVLDHLKLDVHVTSTPELSVETQLGKVAGDADLRIRGTVSKPVVLGRVNITEGDIFFNSTKYHLDRGDILFVNPTTIEPIINLEASARVREYDITLGFHGSLLKPPINTTYRSEPPLPSADIIALLAFGRTREDSVLAQPTQQNFTETASNAILGQALDAAVSSRVQRLFGVSRIKIDPQVGGPESATGARVTIEQQVNENVAVTYITNVARANQQIIQGEFNFTRDLSFVIVRDENGVLGFEFRIRQRKK